MPAFATGIMRGRFSADGALYACGMFAWAGNATAPAGFHRIRRTDWLAFAPVQVQARSGGLEVALSDPLASVDAAKCRLKTWSLKRSANYGSAHIGEKPLPVTAAKLNGTSVILTVPDLTPTQCYELVFAGKDAAGAEVERLLHGTIHRLK